jgi:hypothetical protein
MAKQDIIISIQLKGAEGVSKSTDKVANSQKHLREMMSRSAVELEKLNIKKKRQKELNVQIAKSELGYSEAVGKTAAQLKSSKTQAGLNNAILLESGRLASDASYGFTAMANNLSQLVSLFGSFAKTSGGMTESLKDLGKSLIGTGGVLLAVQLLIGALQSERVIKFIKALGGLSPRLRELGELSEGFSQATEELVGNFDIYTRKLMDSNESEEQKAIALKKLNKEYPDFNASILTTAKNTDEASDSIERYIKQLKKQALSQAAIQQFQEVSGEQSKELFELEMRKLELQDDINRDEIEANRILSKITDDMRADQKLAINEQASSYVLRIAQNKKLIEAVEEESTAVATSYKNRLDIIDDFIILSNDKNEKGSGKRERIFKRGILNLDKLEESYRQRAIDKQMKTADEIINIEEDNAKAELKIRLDVFKEKQAQRLKDFMKSKATDEEKKQAQIDYDKSLEDAQREHDEVMIQLEESFETKRAQLQRKRFNDAEIEREKVEALEKKQLDSRAANLDAINGMGVKQAFNTRTRNLERLREDEAIAKRNVEMAEEGTAVKAQAELDLLDLKRKLALEEQALEQDKFDFINEQYGKISGALTETFGVTAHNQTIEIEERYNREMEAAEGNAELQTQIREKMEKDKDKIARKQFKIDKAAKIGRALMDTYQSGILAFGSQLIIGDPSSTIRAQIAQGVALAAGLANVANIARQKYKSSIGAGGGAGSGGGGGVQIQAPDFNVVGASQTSQLAESVAGQQAKPVKAFVVGKDISTQQELDRNITNTASFG